MSDSQWSTSITEIPTDPPITARDLFAAAALIGIATKRAVCTKDELVEMVESAFLIADAMIFHRRERAT